MRKKITKKEFVKQYAYNSKMTVGELLKIKKVIPCDCEEENCKGWQMVNNQYYLK